MPPDIEVYPLRIWQKVTDLWQLQQDDVVRLRGSETRWSVRAVPAGDSRKLRLRAFDEDGDVDRNVFFHESIVFLVEEDLLEKLLLADVRQYDVWTNERQAFTYMGSSGQWRGINGVLLETEQLPDDLVLTWRRLETDHES